MVYFLFVIYLLLKGKWSIFFHKSYENDSNNRNTKHNDTGNDGNDNNKMVLMVALRWELLGAQTKKRPKNIEKWVTSQKKICRFQSVKLLTLEGDRVFYICSQNILNDKSEIKK